VSRGVLFDGWDRMSLSLKIQDVASFCSKIVPNEKIKSFFSQ
jgi:hypothetical protein